MVTFQKIPPSAKIFMVPKVTVRPPSGRWTSRSVDKGGGTSLSMTPFSSCSHVLHQKPGLVVDTPPLVDDAFRRFLTSLLSMTRSPCQQQGEVCMQNVCKGGCHFWTAKNGPRDITFVVFVILIDNFSVKTLMAET